MDKGTGKQPTTQAAFLASFKNLPGRMAELTIGFLKHYLRCARKLTPEAIAYMSDSYGATADEEKARMGDMWILSTFVHSGFPSEKDDQVQPQSIARCNAL